MINPVDPRAQVFAEAFRAETDASAAGSVSSSVRDRQQAADDRARAAGDRARAATERAGFTGDHVPTTRDQGPAAGAGFKPAAGLRPLAGGHLLAAISTSIVGILREHYGRGPMKAKTYALDDIIVVVMRGSGFTPLEQTIMDSGEPAALSPCARTSSASWRSCTGRRSRSHRAQGARVPQPGPRRARHHDGDLLCRRATRRLRRGRDHRSLGLAGPAGRLSRL
jgi:hypothetical protein